MNPLDALQHDRHRYFHGGWMLYRGRTKVQVSVNDRGRFSIRRNPNERWQSVAASHLRPYYPEGGCINSYSQGICVERRARQTARRTASTSHYTVTFTPPQRPVTLDTQIMWDLVRPRAYPSWRDAIRNLQAGDTYSVAISPDLILYNSNDGMPYTLLWRDMQIGEIMNGMFVPNNDGSCYVKVARQALAEINAPCL